MKNPSVNITPTLNWLFPIVSHHSAKGSTAFYLPITWKLFCSVIVSSTSKDWHFILLRQELMNYKHKFYSFVYPLDLKYLTSLCNL